MLTVSGVCLALLLYDVSAEDIDAEGVEYLTQFGYIETGSGAFVDVTVFNDALKKFQDFAGLEKTGRLDKETRKLMQTPRCGLDDRLASFVTKGSSWQKKVLTYRILKYPTARGLSRQDVDLETKKAFSMWQEVSGLRFQEKSSGSVDIKIRFDQYAHGDGNSFDGPGGVLAHAYFPRFGGDAHFDDSEKWSVTPFVGNQLLNTLTHEFGHSLGLSHSNVRGSIMAPFYKGWDPKLQLGQDDRKGIQSLYGQPTGNVPIKTERPVRFTTTLRTTTRKSIIYTTRKPNYPGLDNTDLCSSEIDAIVQTADGSSYVFTGENYWMLTGDNVAKGYPRKISQDWPGLPANIDAALTWKTKKVTYFFKGDKYWRFTGQSPSTGYPRDISNWPGLPANLDAAIEWGKNGNLYFFKGSQYWKYNTDLNSMDGGYPRDISAWKNIPSNVDAAFQWGNGKTYFFKSGNYWRFNDKTVSVDRSNPPFPRDAGQWWFGCPRKRLRLPFVDGTDDAFVEEVDTEH